MADKPRYPYFYFDDNSQSTFNALSSAPSTYPLGLVFPGLEFPAVTYQEYNSSATLENWSIGNYYVYYPKKVKLKSGYYLASMIYSTTLSTPYSGQYVVILDKDGKSPLFRKGTSKLSLNNIFQLYYIERSASGTIAGMYLCCLALDDYTGYSVNDLFTKRSNIYTVSTEIGGLSLLARQPLPTNGIFQFNNQANQASISYSGAIRNDETSVTDLDGFKTYKDVLMYILWGLDTRQNPSAGDQSAPTREGGYTPEPEPGPSPYDPAGPSTSGGGDGSFDNKSDPVDFTELPSLSVVNSGFAGLFKPTLSQLNKLANYLWNEDINFDQLKKLVANPIDLLISLTIMPVDPPTAGSESIKVGFIDTGISINKIENQYMSIDFGSLEVKEYYGNALDYSPYTKISIYLPYIGLKQLNTDDVMKKTLALRYNVDLFTGACVAEIKAGESVLYTFTGNIANQIPLSAESFNSFLSGLIQAAASVGVAIASHGTSVATQGAAEAGEVSALTARGAQTASNLASMNAALTSAGAVATSKPDILHSGSMTANNGYLAGKTPYLIYEVPRACIPENYQTFVGYPSNITKALSEVTGFTVVDSIHLENIPATDRELAEIERLLKGGVIL